MNITTIISIDWDHTFRNMAGIDLGILALVLYAKSKHIPVGLTTHRDLENTTLYTLYPSQYQKPDDIHDALAAAISYWDQHLFKPLNITFDFINVRYQPRYETGNYYQDKLYDLEKKLAQEIMENYILDNSLRAQEKIKEYAQAEDLLANNKYKEAQMLWLSEQFTKEGHSSFIYHIDDDPGVCQQLPHEFSNVHTIFYEHSPFFSNQSSLEFLDKIGMLNDMQNFINQPFIDDPQRCLSLCLALLQVITVDDALFAMIETVIKDMKSSVTTDLIYLYQLMESLLRSIKITGQPVYLLNNYFRLEEITICE